MCTAASVLPCVLPQVYCRVSRRSVLANVRASLSLFLPDEDVGAVLGKKGQNLIEIQQV